MKLKYLISSLIILTFLISSCANQPKQPVCNKPYILVGNECCLDKDSNSICDKDESKENLKAKEEPKQTCNKPYIQVGSECCLDKNDNQICDKDETAQEKAKEETKTFTIEDLQADIGNVLAETVVLTKDTPLDYAQIYSNKVSNTKFLGKYGSSHYSKVLTKKPETVIQITNSKYYLKDGKDFQNFITKNKDIFIESALKSKEVFENEFKEELPKMIYLSKFPLSRGGTVYNSEKTEYTNHSELSSVVYYDNVTFPETVSENLAKIDYVRINKYELVVNHPDKWGVNGYSESLSNINYGQSIIVQCSPNLVIGLSFENYGDGSYTTYERKYDGSGIDSSYFLASMRDHYQKLIRDSQALTKMCEQRYQFTYERFR